MVMRRRRGRTLLAANYGDSCLERSWGRSSLCSQGMGLLGRYLRRRLGEQRVSRCFSRRLEGRWYRLSLGALLRSLRWLWIIHKVAVV